MTLEQWSSLSQVVAAAGVLASLVFVGFQIRQNTLAMIAQSQQHIATSWFTVGQLIADHAAAFGAGLKSNHSAFANLKDEGRLRFVSIIFPLFKHYENIFLKFTSGRVDEGVWGAWSFHMKVYFHQPGVQAWWKIREEAFAPSFPAFLESSEAPAVPSPAKLMEPPSA
jgi:hypothetical protein